MLELQVSWIIMTRTKQQITKIKHGLSTKPKLLKVIDITPKNILLKLRKVTFACFGELSTNLCFYTL